MKAVTTITWVMTASIVSRHTRHSGVTLVSMRCDLVVDLMKYGWGFSPAVKYARGYKTAMIYALG